VPSTYANFQNQTKDLMLVNGTVQFTNPLNVKQLDLNETRDYQNETHHATTKLPLDQLVERFEPAGKCATIIYPNMCLQDRFQEWIKINQYFKLHPRVKSIADGFVRRMVKSELSLGPLKIVVRSVGSLRPHVIVPGSILNVPLVES